MAATLFALVGMRNAAPGGPPIGSPIDYIAFFWAEAIIATGGRRTTPYGATPHRTIPVGARTARNASWSIP